MSDIFAALLIFLIMMVIVYIGWMYFPHPRANGGFILGAVAVVATLLFFAKSRAGLPVWPRALGFAAMILLAQVILQALAATGVLKR